MRWRDASVLFISALAMYLALEGGNDYEVQRKWEVELKPTLYSNGRFAQEGEHVPKPIIDDLDGDGVNELIVATRDPKLKIFDPSHPVLGRHAQSTGDMMLLLKSETTLLSKARVRSGRQPVAMATGYLLPASARKRHKVVVVLTHDWTVMCFDHHLKLLWESNPMKVKLSHAYHREASISISPTKIKPFDTGLVIVGASMVYEDHKRLHRRKPKPKNSAGSVPGEVANSTDTERHRAVRNRIKAMLGLPTRGDGADEQWEEDHDENEDVLEHFNYFAFDGKRGALRWKHKAGDFMPLGHDHEVTVPQHNYKLELHTEHKHAGEVDWRQYRSSVLNTLPHVWRRPADTRIYTSHFSRKQDRDFDAEKKRADSHHAREVGFFSEHDPAKGAGKASRAGRRNKARGHSKSAKRQEDRDRRGLSLSVKKAASTLAPVKHANVLVTHRMDGIEVLHLHTGRPLCELPLPPFMAHADLNGDGAVDRVEAVVSEGAVVRPEGHQVSDVAMPHCYAWVTTGTPPTHSLFNQTICQAASPFRHLVRSLSAAGQAGDTSGGDRFLVASPVVIPGSSKPSSKGSRNKGSMDMVFLVNDGLVTCVSSNGRIKWQVQTMAYWTQPALVRLHASGESLMAGEDLESSILVPVAPVVESFKIQATDDEAEHLLVLGMARGAILSSDGRILTQFLLPDVPTGPPAIGDWDSDGHQDIVFTSRAGRPPRFVLLVSSRLVSSRLVSSRLLLIDD